MNKIYKYLTFAFVYLVLSQYTHAQPAFERKINIPVEANGQMLAYPWSGGLNNPQFSEIDLNNDDIKDLFIFDRAGRSIHTLINKGTVGEISYEYTLDYLDIFPTTLKHWVLLIDYNCDGVEDIFTANENAIEVWTATRNEEGHISFSKTYDKLTYEGDSTAILFVSDIDIPALDDIDGDGDLDILTFEQGGNFVNFYSNQAVENGQSCEALQLELVDECWGTFFEDLPVGLLTLTLGKCSEGLIDDEDIPQNFDKNNRHAGSTLLTLDVDSDGDKDLMMGDLAANNFVLAVNGGDNTNATIISQDTIFPNYSRMVSIANFPAPFLVDVNNDGLKDLLAAPNRLPAAILQQNYNCVWYYQNTGNTPDLRFNFRSDTLLIDNMIDVDKISHPAFFDHNNDGLMDIVIGNYGYYVDSETFRPALALYENIGTATAPAFRLITKNYANINQSLEALQQTSYRPTFGDIDGDGDEDMILGGSQGWLSLFVNNPKDGAACFSLQNLTVRDVNGNPIDAKQSATPQLVDMNEDGLLDLIIGAHVGTLEYWQNIGTANEAIFDLVTNKFGLVDVKRVNESGYAVPLVFSLPNSTEKQLLVGSEGGSFYHYTDITNNLNDGDAFTLNTDTYGDITLSTRSSPAIADMDGDGSLDIITGNYRGGLLWYKGDFTIDVPIISAPQTKLHMYPNPTQNQLTISLENRNAISKSAKLTIQNTTGQILLQQDFRQQTHISTSDWPNGVYFCTIFLEDEIVVNEKIVKY